MGIKQAIEIRLVPLTFNAKIANFADNDNGGRAAAGSDRECNGHLRIFLSQRPKPIKIGGVTKRRRRSTTEYRLKYDIMLFVIRT